MRMIREDILFDVSEIIEVECKRAGYEGVLLGLSIASDVCCDDLGILFSNIQYYQEELKKLDQ
jgi:hypothetical protein